MVGKDKNLKDLKSLRNSFKNFVNEIIESNPEKGSINLDKVTKPVFAEGAWIQFLFILKFPFAGFGYMLIPRLSNVSSPAVDLSVGPCKSSK